MTPLMKAMLMGFISFFVHLKVLSNLWGRYDPKTEKHRLFPYNQVISLHRIKYNTSMKSS